VLATSVAIATALSLVVVDAVSTMFAAPASAQDRAVAAGERVSDESRTPAVERPSSDPLAIREAHSDGGYWYWAERLPADGGIGGRR
jgi:hypothetical protein